MAPAPVPGAAGMSTIGLSRAKELLRWKTNRFAAGWPSSPWGRGRREAVSLSSRPAFSLIVDLMEGGAGEVRLADTAGQDVLRLVSDGARVTVAYRCAGRSSLTLDAPLGGARQLMLIATGYSLGLYGPAG